VNLEFDDDADALVGEAARVFRGVAPVDRRRTGEPGTWARVAAAGWGGLGAAMEAGDLEPAVAAAVAREAGRTLLVEELVTSGVVLAAFVAHVPAAARGPWEERLADRPGALLGDGRALAFDTVGPTTGFCFGVGEPVDAYRLRRVGERLLLGVSSDPAPTVEPIAGLSPAVARVTATGAWDEVATDLDDAALARIARVALVVHAAALVGCAEELLARTVAYVQERVQFGVAIASFQAVQHVLADVLTSATVAWSAVLAAVADGAGDDGRALVARYLAVECAHAAAAAAAQFHGGLGFTWECDVHWFLTAVLDGGLRFAGRDELATVIGRRFREAAVVGTAC
jgi:alkylation response protein AidB-like acyl-CoA dehydrogenase